MLTTKSRAALVAAIAAVAVLGAIGAAQAVTVKGTTTEVMAHLNKPKQDVDLRFRSSGDVSVVHVIDHAELTAHATAAGEGDGATQEACARRASLINRRAYEIIAILIGLAGDHRDYESAEAAMLRMVAEIEETLEDGCSIAYEEGPPPDGPVLL